MITRLSGTNGGMDDDGAIIIETVGGVGYRVLFSDRDRTVINQKGVHALCVAIRAHTREDGTTLYGFLHADDRLVFDRVCKVKGLGARAALALLSVQDAKWVTRVLDSKDVAVLQTIPGIGKTNAAKLCGLAPPPKKAVAK